MVIVECHLVLNPSMVATLPHNVWVNVAQYLPASSLEGLLSVNRCFFDIAMDYRYRQLIFAYLDNKMIRKLLRLRYANR